MPPFIDSKLTEQTTSSPVDHFKIQNVDDEFDMNENHMDAEMEKAQDEGLDRIRDRENMLINRHRRPDIPRFE